MVNYQVLTRALDRVIGGGSYEIIDSEVVGYIKYGDDTKIDDIQVFPNIDGPDIFESIFRVSGLTWMKKLDRALELYSEKKKKEEEGYNYRRMRLIMFINNRQSTDVRLLINHNTQVVIRIWTGISDHALRIREIFNILSIQSVYGIHMEVVDEQLVGAAVNSHHQQWLDRAIDGGNERLHRLILKSIGLYDDIHHDNIYLEYKFKLINQMYMNNEIGTAKRDFRL